MRARAGVAALAMAVLSCACGGSGSASQFWPLAVDGRHFRDADGRVVLLRGVNARVRGLFDVTFDDGRTALEPIPALGSEDCSRMRELGFNLLRLPVNWSGIEPEEGSYDEDYLAAVDAAISCASDAGLFVLVDLHQDAYSKEIGEDGAPLWAIVPPPDELLEGPLEDLEERRLSAQVDRAFESFFDPTDSAGLQASFIHMLELVGARYGEHPAVVGFEIFNEPVAGAEELDAFQFRAAEALREAAPKKLVFFEPPAIRNFLDFQPLAGSPFPVSGAVYSPHIYTFIFGDAEDALQNLDKESLRPSVDNARAEAEAWATPLFVGEFGAGPDTTNADLWMRYEAELQDEYLASSAFWLWKEQSQGRWGVFEEVDGSWEERPQVVAWLSRIYPQRIAGEPDSLSFDGATGVMTLRVSGAGQGETHRVYVPEASATSFSATCDGSPVSASRDAATGVVDVACAGELTVIP